MNFILFGMLVMVVVGSAIFGWLLRASRDEAAKLEIDPRERNAGK